MTVSTELATLAPGVMEAGENEQFKPSGKPEHAKAIELLNEPASGVAVTVIFPLFPVEIVNIDGFAPKLRFPLVLLSCVQFNVTFTAFDI